MRVLSVLEKLCQDPKNTVIIHSGREKNLLQDWLGHLNVCLSAEDGFFFKPSGKSEWQQIVSPPDLDMSWRGVVKTVFDYFAERTPGSLVEEKEMQITWHYRNADPDFGSLQARELQTHLDNFFGKLPVAVAVNRSNKTLTVKYVDSTLPSMLKKWMAEDVNSADFTLFIGEDDVSEELTKDKSDVYVCTIGFKISDNRYYLKDVNDVLDVLRILSNS